MLQPAVIAATPSRRMLQLRDKLRKQQKLVPLLRDDCCGASSRNGQVHEYPSPHLCLSCCSLFCILVCIPRPSVCIVHACSLAFCQLFRHGAVWENCESQLRFMWADQLLIVEESRKQ